MRVVFFIIAAITRQTVKNVHSTMKDLLVTKFKQPQPVLMHLCVAKQINN
jgi:hypothetical protein